MEHPSRVVDQAIAAITGQPPEAAPESYRVDGPDPRWFVCPGSEEQVAALLALAQEKGLSVVPRGSGARDRMGAPLRRADLILSTRALDGVVEYEPADLTVTVRAGTTLAALQATLGRHGQWLPLDPPGPASATIGGLVAAGMAGPRRLAYGAPRDLVLGMRVALTHGFAVRCGGKVVKNVAGYDLNKLMIGSMGTLGIITEVSLKVRPRPAASCTAVLSFADLESAAAAARAVVQSELVPAALELVNPLTAGLLGLPGPYALLVALEETPRAVATQAHRLQEAGRVHGATDLLTREGEEEAALWGAYATLAHRLEEAATLKAAVPLRSVAALIAQAERLASPELALYVQGGPGTGVVRIHLASPPGSRDEPPCTLDAVRAAITLAGAAEASGGSLVVEAGQPSFKAQVDVWGAGGPALALMRQIKQSFDPAGVLNPGRFIGGI